VTASNDGDRWLVRLRLRARALKAETYALYLAYRDPRVPWYAKVFASVVVAYAFSPLDLVPDFIPILGYLDDLILVPLGITLALKMIPPDVMAESRIRAAETLRDGKPCSWVAAAAIFGIWLALLVLSILWTVRLFGSS
jgi:uncharacterized membrane protein YkvA (DUF1232 family)